MTDPARRPPPQWVEDAYAAVVIIGVFGALGAIWGAALLSATEGVVTDLWQYVGLGALLGVIICLLALWRRHRNRGSGRAQ